MESGVNESEERPMSSNAITEELAKVEIEEASLLRVLLDRKHLREQVQHLLTRGTELLDLYRERLGARLVKVECMLARDSAGVLSIPRHQTKGAAGLDLQSAEITAIRPGGKAQIRTGLSIAIPEGHVGKIFPRSGLAHRDGIIAVDGTIDSDYRGEIRILLLNVGTEIFHVKPGMRIAQLVVLPCVRVSLAEVDALPATERGAGGFGSTGV
jgi:dUTP pyrophosphatase